MRRSEWSERWFGSGGGGYLRSLHPTASSDIRPAFNILVAVGNTERSGTPRRQVVCGAMEDAFRVMDRDDDEKLTSQRLVAFNLTDFRVVGHGVFLERNLL
ncbi:hypothetical protein PIB30_001639 [Stylosanthes scabra]|uniref:EF-hand domain-containing protein n=1 Tax=Stylosanthes scabra TaxID=79078 RepID=A0ABU6T4I8_9FABA|nr:hypothetical protein [Stylosanthes scabra]